MLIEFLIYNIYYNKMEVDRRRALLAELNLDDSMLTHRDEENEKDEEFNPFHSRDFIIIILELCPPETLSKLYRANKYIRQIISENQKYVALISEHKYKVVWLRYENLLRAYKVREDMILTNYTGIGKAIQEEKKHREELYESINDLSFSNFEYSTNRNRHRFLIPRTGRDHSIGNIVNNALNIDQLQRNAATPRHERIKEPDLDDIFERQKLEALQGIIEHQKKMEIEHPTFNERQHGINSFTNVNITDVEDQFQQQLERRKKRKHEQINQHKMELIKAHEVEIKSIECLSIFEDKESSLGDVINAFCSYKLSRWKKQIQNIVK